MHNPEVTWVAQCGQLLADRKLTIAFAESATAGKIAYDFSLLPEAGSILKGGLVCYDACIKEDVLGIPKDIIEEFTPESAEVTRAMALKLFDLMPADVVVAVTGLAGPGGSETVGKPVGTFFYCILMNQEVTERRKIFNGTPEEMIRHCIREVAKTIIRLITTT